MTMTPRVVISVDRDGYTNGIQLSINAVDDDGCGHGYRIFGPKYLGDSELVREYTLDKRDADEIRRYLDLIA